MQSFQSMRCSYGGCPWPDEAGHYLQVYDGTIAGGRDWSSLAGKVICDTCYEQYKESGSLDVATSSSSGSSSSRASTSAKRCSYERCTSANASSQLLKIQAGTSAGGQDWTSLVGRVLCHECCNRFMAFGSLDADPICPPCAPARRCGYEHCHRPDQSYSFHEIKDTTEAGGQDWTSLVGRVLCATCYGRFARHGSLEGGTEPYREPLSAEEKRYGYEHCLSPDQVHKLYQIKDTTEAGGQDWTSLIGRVLCTTCYERYRKTGSLEGGRGPRIKPPGAEEKRCVYEHCLSPDQSRQFLQIKDTTTAGGQDWSSLVGRVLCQTCYEQYRQTGSLDRQISPPSKRQGTGPRIKPLSAGGKRCGYEHCLSPDQSSQFYQIKDTTTAGGQDWTSLIGRVLCRMCYRRFWGTGSLDRQISPPSKRQKTSA